MRMKTSELVDLLVDDDARRALLLVSVSVDTLRSAATLLEEADDISNDAAMIAVVAHLLRGLGARHVQVAIGSKP
ncbi:hypothetical protein [Bradyrhizobium elkanii]|uniref:hypothetical protein n=1 Tax=Bradyrhizobium elkanii TaxID=29448 RepID=UPI0004BC5047|nr:hypothetical protein [Bradyrhizobium elkanii]WLA79620.1 hypothetical protein QNJ99_30015 [Bradyrhizobium elkanii]